MTNRTIDNFKLGIFVLAGLVLVILFFYMMGKNQSIFGKRFEVKAHFENVGGLTTGNNVRLAGIVVGVVDKVNLLNDTMVEVSLALEMDMLHVVRKNVRASLGTDGLIGNRVINLLPSNEPAPLIEPGDVIQSKKELDMDAMLETLSKTNKNVLTISEQLKETMNRINNSAQLSALLNDVSMSHDLKAALQNLKNATGEANTLMVDMRGVIGDVRQGKGSVGQLLKDTTLAAHLNEAARRVKTVEDQANKLVQDVDALVLDLRADVNKGAGPANLVLKDSLASARLQSILENVEQGTARFSEDMEALKHNFLFRRYFKKMEKEKKKAQGQ